MHEVRKTVTVLFADVVASTELGERMDLEAVRQVMSTYFAEMAEVVELHGGTVEKFIGDEVMAVFGVPVVHEDDALRAVRAAASMRARLQVLNAGLEERWGARLEIRMGINTGEVVAGDPSTGHGFVTGDAVNLAKRIEQSAAPGEILLGELTSRIVGHAVATTAAGPFSVKGKRDRIAAQRLVEVDLTSEAFPRRLDAPLVGRANEVATLLAGYTQVVETRRPQLVTVLGQPGIGKSRLVRELLEGVASEARVLVGRCVPYGEGITFWPVREILPGESFEGTREEIFFRIRKQLEGLAREQPLVVCFEDVHWGEPTFLDLVQYLVGWINEAPIQLVCLARPELLEKRPDWPRNEPNATVLTLAPLSGSEAEQLLELLQAPDGARTRIAQAAEGNPLFVEQMTAIAAEEGAEVAIPLSIQAVLAARLGSLDRDDGTVIECASVIGRDFSARAALELVPEELRPRVSTLLLGLMRKELVRPHAVGDEDGFRFHHALIRDAAYDGMPKRLRADLHERHANWLEAGEHQDFIVGHHLEQAVHLRRQLALSDGRTQELALKAGELIGAAGRRAFRRGDMPAARGLLERADALLPEGAPRVLALRGMLANAMWQVGDVTAAEALLESVQDDAARTGDRGLEWSARLDLATRRAVHQAGAVELQETARKAIQVFEELGDDGSLTRARRAIGIVAIRAGQYGEAQEHLEQAFEHAPPSLSPAERARAADALCTALLYGPAEADGAVERCRELLRAAPGNLTLEANVASSLAGLVAMLGRWDESRSLYARAHEIFDELGLRMPLAGLTQVTGGIELLAGDYVAAERELRLGYEILTSAGVVGGPLAPHAALLAAALIAQERLADAHELLSLAEDAMSTEDLPSLIVVRTVRAHLDTRRGEARAGTSSAVEAIAVAEKTDALNLTGDAYAALAEAHDRLAEPDAAATARGAAFELFRRKGNRAAAHNMERSQALFVTDRTR
jgi:class 3 adenylate cyclase/tetratricopeptide (TPR) repeat protein